MLRRLFKFVFWGSLILGLLALTGAGLFLTWGYFKVTRDLPRISKLDDYRPAAVSQVFDRDSNLIAEFYKERRYPVKLNEVPELVQKAFIAAEDSAFYTHPGIDFVSIFRAVLVNLRTGSSSQGASTITQQVVKNLLLTAHKDYERKIKEAILAYRLEQHFSKDEILEIYLNQMFFGNTAYGIKAAAKLYFHKELKDLIVPEAAILAGLLQAPSRDSPVANPQRAKKRQRYVLKQMRRAGFISPEVEEEAINTDVKVYSASAEKVFADPYYVSEVRRTLIDKLGEEELDSGGYKIYTAVDSKATQLADAAVKMGLREVDKRRGWRGAIDYVEPAARAQYVEKLRRNKPAELKLSDVYPALITEISPKKDRVFVDLGGVRGVFKLGEANWARRQLGSDGHVSGVDLANELKVGQVVEVAQRNVAASKEAALDPVAIPLQLDQTPEIEGALVALNPHDGQVLAMIGGYDYKKSVFNRVTQSQRQPGSSFKPILYLTAIDNFGYTPATIVYDEPRSYPVGDTIWTPGNYDEKFLGPITMRTALEKSKNLASADIISRIGVEPVINMAHKLGVLSPLGRNLSLALGSSEVNLLEMARAYGVLAAKGLRVESTLVSKIEDRKGQVTFDIASEILSKAEQVLNEKSAFIITNMMKGVIEHGTGVKVKALGRPVAGKTGTSNDQMDAWFIGFTPEYVCGVWIGFDVKKKIGEKETGGVIAAPVWLNFMQPYLKIQDEKKYQRLLEESKAEAARLGIEPEEVKVEPLDFSVPEGVDPAWITKETGLLSTQGAEGAILEYFISGTEPQASTLEQGADDYLKSTDL